LTALALAANQASSVKRFFGGWHSPEIESAAFTKLGWIIIFQLTFRTILRHPAFPFYISVRPTENFMVEKRSVIRR